MRPARALGEVLRNLFKKPATVRYPHEPAKVDAKFRGKIVFEAAKCIGCRLCVKDCPAAAIEITPDGAHQYIFAYNSVSEKKKKILAVTKPGPRKFKCAIDLSKCIYCAQCVDTCPKKALASSQDFELAALTKLHMTAHYPQEAA